MKVRRPLFLILILLLAFIQSPLAIIPHAHMAKPGGGKMPTNLFGAGFNSSSPYVELFWDWDYDPVTIFEIQSSPDNELWNYLGNNASAQYTDFNVLNGTERFYRVRGCDYVDAAWDNATWSDVNYEKVYFVLPNGEMQAEPSGNPDEEGCYSHEFNASSITVIVGTLNDGNLASTFSVDGDWYNVSEINDTPGLDVRVNFTGICEDIICGGLDIYHTYTGHSHHEVCIGFYNFNSSTWIERGAFTFNETVGSVCVGLGDNPDHLVDNG
ncbi:unnamed protein product, partial [marine sediment metagenome]